MDRGSAMFGFLLSIIVTPIALLCFSFFKKRYKNFKAKSGSTLVQK